VRFAESHGFEHDYDRPTAYHYRDFVIKAINSDLPFDTFAKWQLAGDELAPGEPLAVMATGYLAAGVHSTQITKNEVEKHRYDELDDILGNVGTTFLGLTVGCARCHDHKYDAIPARDYYRMLSAFTTVVRTEVDLDLDPQGYATAKAAFDAKHRKYLDALAAFEKEQLPARFAAWERARGGQAAAGGRAGCCRGWRRRSRPAGRRSPRSRTAACCYRGRTRPPRRSRSSWSTDLTQIRSLRLEALAHPSLVKNGPGRAANGNFALVDLASSRGAGAEGAASRRCG
jgi:hypothetical protein